MSLLADGTIFHNNRLTEVHPRCGLGRLMLQRIQSRFQMPLTEVQPRMLTASPRRRPPVQGIQEQIYHVLEGEGLMEIAGKNHVVRKHDFIFLPPGVEHAISNSGLVDLVFLVITSPVTDDGKDAWPWQRASPPELFWSKRFRAGRYGEVSTRSAPGVASSGRTFSNYWIVLSNRALNMAQGWEFMPP